ncbi:MAG TPA: cytochrome c [Candidatus Acidoferrum sp.]|nr:cytochrome c [Candidatus Acidoferrum sp.]
MTRTNDNWIRGLTLILLLFPWFPSFAQESRVGKLTGEPSRGKKLYQRYCIGCHGEHGDGRGENAAHVDPKPRDFTSGTFKCRSTPSGSIPLDADLFDTIGRGLYTTAMPAWLPLARQQRADLVAYVKSFSPRFREEKLEAPLEIPPETPATQESIDRGRELYQTTIKCSLCHGKEGRGDGPSAATLTDSKGFPIVAYDFTGSSRFKCGESDEDLYRILMTGLDGSPMASFSNSLKPEQAWDLIHYVRTFRTGSHRGSKNLHAKKLGELNRESGQ